MRHYSRLVGVASVLVLASAFVIAPLTAGAFWDGFPFGKPGIGSGSGIQAGSVTLCPRTITAAGISVNVFIPNKRGCDTPPPPPPPPVDECPNVPGTQDEGPCADQVCEDDGGTWDGDSCELPPPPPEGALLITEVLYDLTTSTTSPQGTESANEWVEIFNGTNANINLSNYTIADASSTDALPDVVLPAGAYAVIVASSTTVSFWSIPAEAVVVQLTNVTIGNGLGNGGDMVSLFDEVASTTVDAVSWGTNTAAFSPSVPTVDVNAGHSIARHP